MTHLTDVQEQWLKDLEGGEFKQGKGALWSDIDGQRGYCCLGVATQRIDPDSEWMQPDDSGLASDGGCAPTSVATALGLRSVTGRFHPKAPDLNGCRTLAGANDGGATFSEVAAYIRKYLWAVFSNIPVPEEYQ